MIKWLTKKWLGVDKLEEKTSDVALRHLVGKAVSDALKGEKDYQTAWGVDIWDIENLLKRCIQRAVEEYEPKKAEQLIKDRIYTEEFIDEVVERLKRKQLPKK